MGGIAKIIQNYPNHPKLSKIIQFIGSCWYFSTYGKMGISDFLKKNQSPRDMMSFVHSHPESSNRTRHGPEKPGSAVKQDSLHWIVHRKVSSEISSKLTYPLVI